MYLVIKLLVDNDSINDQIIDDYRKVYTEEVKRAAEYLKRTHKDLYFKNVSARIHTITKYEIIREARKFNEGKNKQHYLLNPVWRPKSYELSDNSICLRFGESYHLPFLKLKLRIRDYQFQQLEKSTLHSVKLKKSGIYWYIYLTANMKKEKATKGTAIMGVDLGIRVPAVCATSNNKAKFVGNGRYIRFVERNLKAKYRKLDKSKNKKAIKQMNHKLANIKHHLDHQYAKEVIDFALLNQVSTIKLERLTGIQKVMVKKSMQKEYTWSYRRMQEYLIQKAKAKGIKIVYISPRLTSKICPQCSKINNPNGRRYTCSCGYRGHRDLVGAINIMRSTAIC